MDGTSGFCLIYTVCFPSFCFVFRCYWCWPRYGNILSARGWFRNLRRIDLLIFHSTCRERPSKQVRLHHKHGSCPFSSITHGRRAAPHNTHRREEKNIPTNGSISIHYRKRRAVNCPCVFPSSCAVRDAVCVRLVGKNPLLGWGATVVSCRQNDMESA